MMQNALLHPLERHRFIGMGQYYVIIGIDAIVITRSIYSSCNNDLV